MTAALTTKKIPSKSLAFFTDLANDAGNWSGQPWLDGNVASGKSASAMSQTLVRHGLIKIGHGGDDGGAFAYFTDEGVEFAASLGIDLKWLDAKYDGIEVTQPEPVVKLTPEPVVELDETVVHSGSPRETGTPTSILKAGKSWSVRCETHGTVSEFKGSSAAWRGYGHPKQWCKVC